MPLLEHASVDPIRMSVHICSDHDGFPGCLKHGWKDSHADRSVEQFLYDLEADPYELNNLVGRKSHEEVAHGLREQLKKRMQLAGEQVPDIVSASEA